MKKVIKTCSVNPGLVSIGFMHTAKLSDLILSVKGSNRGLVLLRLAVRSGTERLFKNDGVLEASEAALDAFSKITVSLN